MPHLLLLGYGLDDERTEAVSKNTMRLKRRAEQAGYRVSVANIGYPHSQNCIENTSSISQAILARGRILWQLESFIRRERVTHLHDVFVLPLASLIFAVPLKQKIARLWYIKEVHNFPGYTPKLQAETLIRVLANRSGQLNRVIQLSDQAFSRNYSISNAYNLPFFPAPISIKHFKPRSARGVREPIRVCYLGHPLKKKGIFRFPEYLRIMGQSKKNAYHFTFALSDLGARNQVVSLLQQASQKSGVPITVVGKVDPPEFFREQDVLVLPLQDEFSATSTPNTILEAMEAGVVVITTQTPSVQKVIEHEKSGYVVSDLSPEILSAILEKIRTAPRLAPKISQRARLWLEATYNGENEKKLMKMLYEKDR